jgi:hypothetical protein
VDHATDLTFLCIKAKEGQETDKLALDVVEEVVKLVCWALMEDAPVQFEIESFILIAALSEVLNLV